MYLGHQKCGFFWRRFLVESRLYLSVIWVVKYDQYYCWNPNINDRDHPVQRLYFVDTLTTICCIGNHFIVLKSKTPFGTCRLQDIRVFSSYLVRLVCRFPDRFHIKTLGCGDGGWEIFKYVHKSPGIWRSENDLSCRPFHKELFRHSSRWLRSGGWEKEGPGIHRKGPRNVCQMYGRPLTTYH